MKPTIPAWIIDWFDKLKKKEESIKKENRVYIDEQEEPEIKDEKGKKPDGGFSTL